MKQDKISRTQLMALLWAGVLAPAAEQLPALLLPSAGKGAWLSVLAAAPLVLAADWVLDRLAGRRGAAALRAWGGPVLGRGLILIYIVWAQILLAVRLRLCAQRLVSSGYRDGALWFFLGAAALLALWMGLGQLPAFARAGQLFLAALLAVGGVVLVLSVSQARVERLLPVWREDLPGVLYGALPAAGVIGWGMFTAFLSPQVREQGERRGWHWLFWGMGSCAVLSLAQAVILGNLGAGLAAELDNPFFALAKSVGVEGAFQRVESIVAAVWTFADLTMAGVLLFAVRELAGALTSRPVGRPAVLACVLVGVVLALSAFSGGAARRWSREIIPWGNLILGLGVPVAAELFRWARGKRRGSKHI